MIRVASVSWSASAAVAAALSAPHLPLLSCYSTRFVTSRNQQLYLRLPSEQRSRSSLIIRSRRRRRYGGGQPRDGVNSPVSTFLSFSSSAFAAQAYPLSQLLSTTTNAVRSIRFAAIEENPLEEEDYPFEADIDKNKNICKSKPYVRPLASSPASMNPSMLQYDTQWDDPGFGANDYSLDEYELEEIKRHEQMVQAEFYRDILPPMDNEMIHNQNHQQQKQKQQQHHTTNATPQSMMSTATFTPLSKPKGQASSGYSAAGAASVDLLEAQLRTLQNEIYERNGGQSFNINSPAQVSRILFGSSGESTEKSLLEAKAANGNRMAELILQYRSVKRQFAKLNRRQESIQRGLHVSDPRTTMTRAVQDPQQQPQRTMKSVENDPLLLIDASAYIFRAYYSMPPIHRAMDGMPTGAVLGFCNMLNKLTLQQQKNHKIDDEVDGTTSPPRLVLVFDSKGTTFRHELFNEYKSHRPDAPIDLIPQFALVRQAARAYGIHQLEAPSYEADDVIATLCRLANKEGVDVNIFSGDKDLMQLVTEPGVEPVIQMVDPSTMSRCTYDQVVEKWGVPPSQLGDVLALAGDAADNVPGVPGVGPKIAAQLVREFGTLENLLQNTNAIKQKMRRAKLEEFQSQARLSRVLVDLRKDIPVDQLTFPNHIDRVADLRMQPIDTDRILSFYDEMGWQDIKRRFQNSFLRGQSRPKSNMHRTNKKPKAKIPMPEDYADVPF